MKSCLICRADVPVWFNMVLTVERRERGLLISVPICPACAMNDAKMVAFDTVMRAELSERLEKEALR